MTRASWLSSKMAWLRFVSAMEPCEVPLFTDVEGRHYPSQPPPPLPWYFPEANRFTVHRGSLQNIGLLYHPELAIDSEGK